MQVGFQAQARAQLLRYQHDIDAIAAEPAVSLLERYRGQAQFTQLVPEFIAVATRAVKELLALFEAVIFAHQPSGGVLQHLLLFGQFEVHGLPLTVRESSWR
ncbi:hypothetical protein D9M73_149480 [compost metagenome]